MILELLIRYHKPFNVRGRVVEESISPEYIRLLKRGKNGNYCKGLMLLDNNRQHTIRIGTYEAHKSHNIWKSFDSLSDKLKSDFIENLNYTENKNKIYDDILNFVKFT